MREEIELKVQNLVTIKLVGAECCAGLITTN